MKHLRVVTEVSLTIAIVVAFSVAQESSVGIVAGDTLSKKTIPADPAKDKADSQSWAQRYPRYELRADDVLDISFEFTPDFNQVVVVQPDGYITLREVGDVHVVGLTVPELTEAIRNAYGKTLKDPTIAVVLKDFEKPYFIAGGEVARPGKYELRGDTTVVEAIAIAGGLLKESAKQSQVVLYRRVSQDWMEGRILDVKKMMRDNSLGEDLHVKPGDMVIVPQNRISKIERFLPIPHAGINLSPVP